MFSRSYLTVTFGFGIRAVALAVMVVLLARALGPSDFGGYAAAASLASFFAMFNGLGAGPLHVRDVAHAQLPYVETLNHTVQRIGWLLVPLAFVSVACGWLLVPHNVPPLAIAMIVLGELLNYAGTELAMRVLQARERYLPMALVLCAMPCLRTVVAAAMLATGYLDLVAWAVVSLATGAGLCAGVFGVWALRMRGRLDSRLPLFHDSLAGLGFAVSGAASRVHGDADKVILARLASTATAGTYAIAYRLTDVFMLPINAGVERLLPALFRQGQGGLRQSLRASRTQIILVLGLSLVLSAGVYLAASLLPWILGEGYRETVPIGHALALVPFTMTCWIILRTLAATAGYERSTGAFELAGAAFNVAITIVLVLAWDWRGAVLATYLTQLAMAAAFGGYVVYRSRLAQRAGSAAAVVATPPDAGRNPR